LHTCIVNCAVELKFKIAASADWVLRELPHGTSKKFIFAPPEIMPRMRTAHFESRIHGLFCVLPQCEVMLARMSHQQS
jgi:hypothetical protein